MDLNEKIGQELIKHFNVFAEELHSNSKERNTFGKGLEESNYRKSDKGQSLLIKFLTEKVNIILKNFSVQFSDEERESFDTYMNKLITELKIKFPLITVKEIM